MSKNKIKLFHDYKKRPVVYRMHPFVRWFTIMLGVFAIISAIYYNFTEIGADSSMMKKSFPFIIMLLAINSLAKNIFTINSIKMFDDRIQFHTLLRKTVIIPWNAIQKMSFTQNKIRTIDITYTEEGKEKVYKLLLTFSKMLEIVNNIIVNCPAVETDDLIKNVIEPSVEERRKQEENREERSE